MSAAPTPYYASPDGSVVVYCARWEAVVKAGLVPVRDVALVHADRPYGQKEQTDRATKKRIGKPGPTLNSPGKQKPRDFPAIIGDDKPSGEGPLLALQRPTVVWGGHLCNPALPPSPSWIVWDKRDGTTPDDNGDCEMAWSNLGGPIREFRHLWRGTCRASETGVLHLHPTQKPVALCSWVFTERARLAPGSLVFVPYLGSGPELPAARAAGLRVIAAEVSEDYCAAAVARLRDAPAAVLEHAKAAQRARLHAAPVADNPGPLFAAR